MESKIQYKVFEGEGHPIDASILENITHEQRELLKEMMVSGYYTIGGLDVSKFLQEDLSINLEKLELAVTLLVTALEANSTDEDITIKLQNLDTYYELRGIRGNERQEREERIFMLGYISAVAAEASVRDTLVVKYV